MSIALIFQCFILLTRLSIICYMIKSSKFATDKRNSDRILVCVHNITSPTMRLWNEDGILVGDQLHLGFDRLQMAFPIRGTRKRAGDRSSQRICDDDWRRWPRKGTV